MTLFRPDAMRSQVSILNVSGGNNDENHPGVEARILLPMSVYVSITFNHTGQS